MSSFHFLKFQVDINETDEYGFTALHMASENGHLKVITKMFGFEEFRNCGFIVDQISSSGCGGAFGGRGQVGPIGVRQLPAALAHGHQQGSSGENPPWVHNGLHMLPHNFCLRESIHGLNMTHPGTHCDCQTAD